MTNTSFSPLQHPETSFLATLYISSAYFPHDCLLLSADVYREDKNGPLSPEQNPPFKLCNYFWPDFSGITQEGKPHFVIRRLWLRFSSDFCHGWGNILINMSFSKSSVSHPTHALCSWICSQMACLTIFVKRCFLVLPVFLSNKEDALPNILPLRSQKQKTSTLPQEQKKAGF